MDKKLSFKLAKNGGISLGTVVHIRNIGERTIKEIINLNGEDETFDFLVEEEADGYMSPAIERIVSKIVKEETSPFADIPKRSGTYKEEKKKTSHVLPDNAYNYVKEYRDRLICEDPEIEKSKVLLAKFKSLDLTGQLDMISEVIITLSDKLENMLKK